MRDMAFWTGTEPSQVATGVRQVSKLPARLLLVDGAIADVGLDFVTKKELPPCTIGNPLNCS